MRDLAAVLLGWSSIVCTGTATAQGAPPVPTRLSFSSPARCGNASDFAARVQRRSARIRFVDRGASDTLNVRIAPKGSALVAQVALWSGGKRITQRSIEAEQCEDALDALALVVAVTLEGRASEVRAARAKPNARAQRPRSTTKPPAQAEPSTPEPAPISTETPAPPTPTNEPPTPTPSPAPSAKPAETKPPVAEQPKPAPKRELPTEAAVVDRQPEAPPTKRNAGTSLPLKGGVGGGGILYFGASPSLLPGWLLYGRLGWDRGSQWSPEIIFSYFSVSRDGFAEPNGGQAEIRMHAFALDVCPWRLEHGVFAFQPCAFGAYGKLRARGYETVNAGDFNVRWGVIGANAQLVSTLGVVELRAAASAGGVLTPYTFRFNPDQTLHRVPVLVLSTSIAAGLSFR